MSKHIQLSLGLLAFRMAFSSCSFWWDRACTLSIKSFSTDRWSIWRMITGKQTLLNCKTFVQQVILLYSLCYTANTLIGNIKLTFIALSINLESQAGRGGSWDICNGLDPSDSSILIVTLCTDAVPVFLPKTCWLEKQRKMMTERRNKNYKLQAHHSILVVFWEHSVLVHICEGNT